MDWSCHLYPKEVAHLKQLVTEGDALAAIYLYRYYKDYLGDSTAAGPWLPQIAAFAHLREKGSDMISV